MRVFVNMNNNNSINFTAAAANQVFELTEGKSDLRLRLYIVGGGCAGFQYGFKFDEVVNPDDLIIEQDKAALIIDSMSLQYLAGSTVDYVNNLNGSHFVVSNPNANTTCGCGSSFSV
jgi:iron-sulfur cluster insertion protein